MGKKVIKTIASIGALSLCLSGCFESKEERYAEKLNLGDKYLKEMNYEDAVANYQEAVKIDEKKREAYERMASVYHAKKDYNASIELLNNAMDLLNNADQEEDVQALAKLERLAENHKEREQEPQRIILYPVQKDGRWAFENENEDVICDYIYEDVKDYNEYGLAAVKRDGKWGFIDENGKEIIPCQYEDVSLFGSPGLAAFCEKGKWGYIDRTGKIIVEPIYEEADLFSDNGLAAVKKDGKWGYIMETGEVFIEPVYDKATLFDEFGLAAVTLDGEQMWINENNIPIVEDIEGGIVQNADSEGLAIICSEGKYGLTVYTGNMIQDCIYDSLETIPGYRGLYKAEKDGKYGIIDKDGKVVVDIQYEDFNFFDEKHLGREQLELGNEQLKDLDYKKALEYYQGVLNLEGKEAEAYEHIASLYIMQEDYQEAQKILEEAIQKLSEKEEEPKDRLGLFADMAEKHLEQEKKEESSGTNLYPVFENGKWGFKNKEDKTLISPIYDSIKEYHSQGLAPVRKDGKWGFIDEKGEEVISCKFEDVKLFDDQGYAAFCENGKWGYMDMSGKVIVKAQYEDAGGFSGNGLASVKKDGKWGWINESGKVVIEPIYEMVSEFDKKGLAVVKLDGIPTWINESGVELSKEEKTEVLSQDDEGYVIVKKGKKMLIEDFQGNTLLKGKYDSIEKIPCWPDLYKVSKEGKYGCIDKNGNVVLELQYDDFTYYDQDHLAYFEKDENGNIVGIRYEGEEEAEGTETIEGSYEITIDASNPEVVAEEIDTLYFHSDGTFNVHKIFKVSSISSPSGIVGVEWDSENTVKLSAGESSEYTDPNTYSYTIENGCINTWGQVIPVSEITQN